MANTNIPMLKTHVYYFHPYEDNNSYVKICATDEAKAIEILEHQYGKHAPRKIDNGRDNEKGYLGVLIQYTENFYRRNLIP